MCCLLSSVVRALAFLHREAYWQQFQKLCVCSALRCRPHICRGQEERGIIPAEGRRGPQGKFLTTEILWNHRHQSDLLYYKASDLYIAEVHKIHYSPEQATATLPGCMPCNISNGPTGHLLDVGRGQEHAEHAMSNSTHVACVCRRPWARGKASAQPPPRKSRRHLAGDW